MLIWCLNQVKDFILKFSISRSCFSDKEFLNLYTMILFSFPLGGYVDEVVDNQKKLSRIQVPSFPSIITH